MSTLHTRLLGVCLEEVQTLFRSLLRSLKMPSFEVVGSYVLKASAVEC